MFLFLEALPDPCKDLLAGNRANATAAQIGQAALGHFNPLAVDLRIGRIQGPEKGIDHQGPILHRQGGRLPDDVLCAAHG